jgi:iron complex transport system substrate-binding protein
MVNMKIIAVAVVVVIVVASTGLYLFYNNDKKENSIDVDTALSIMGNANGDYTMNSEDLNIVRDIISGDKSFSDYPLADANNDGVINESDVSIVEKLIARESTNVWVIDQDDKIVELTYPLTNVVTVNVDMTSLFLVIGGLNSIAGYITSSDYTSLLGPVYKSDATLLTTTNSRSIDSTAYLNIKHLDTELYSSGGIGAIFVMTSTNLGGYDADFTAAGIPVVVIKCGDPISSIDAALTIGFLLGTTTETTGLNYVQTCYGILDYIEEKTASVEAKQTCIAFSQYNALAQTQSQYTIVTQLAGGDNITKSEGTSSVKLANTEAITQYDGVQHMINFRTMDLINQDSSAIVSTWEAYMSYFSDCSSYEDLVYLNAAIPVACRVAYAAEILYPDLFSGYADKAFQSFVDDYMGYLNDSQADGHFDVTKDVTTTITYADYQAAKAS